MQDKLAQAIAEALPREAKHNRAGGTPKAAPLPTSGPYDGVHYGRPSTLGPRVPKGLGGFVGAGGPNI
eukprot:2220086-Karenia_brevis.AAC.1